LDAVGFVEGVIDGGLGLIKESKIAGICGLAGKVVSWDW
jgi:hypothetical protein